MPHASAIALSVLGSIFILGGFLCFVVLWIEMFRDELWKGFVGILCFFYTIYYAIAESELDSRWILLGGVILLPGIGTVITSLAVGR